MAKRNGFQTCFLMSIALLVVTQDVVTAEPAKDIVVFDFEMMDSSAGSGIIPQDERDTKYLAESTQVAKTYLLSTGIYKIIDANRLPRK